MCMQVLWYAAVYSWLVQLVDLVVSHEHCRVFELCCVQVRGAAVEPSVHSAMSRPITDLHLNKN